MSRGVFSLLSNNLSQRVQFFIFVFASFLFVPVADATLTREGNVTQNDFAGAGCSRADRDPFQCMVCNVYHEARGEPYAGKVAVARTILTRVRLGHAPDACRVTYQPGQFSWTAGGPRRLPGRGNPNYVALQESVRATAEALRDGPNGTTHFHATWANPSWARSRRCQRTVTHGRHHFYSCTAQIYEELADLSRFANAGDQLAGLPITESGSFDPEWLVPEEILPETERAPASMELEPRVLSPRLPRRNAIVDFPRRSDEASRGQVDYFARRERGGYVAIEIPAEELLQ